VTSEKVADAQVGHKPDCPVLVTLPLVMVEV
jgi:hypothetical protein